MGNPGDPGHGGVGHFLYIIEGVTKVEPLAMIAYGLGVILLIREL